MPEARNNQNSHSKLGRQVMRDLKRGDLRRALKRDLSDLYNFYLTDEDRLVLSKRWLFGRQAPVRGVCAFSTPATFLYSDGVTEAHDARWEFYGDERLAGLLPAAGVLTAKPIHFLAAA